jgi:hypothetical protein
MTQKRGCGFGTYKQQGEWAELCFMARAAGQGLRVLKPYGDSASYDVGGSGAGGADSAGAGEVYRF